MFEWFCWKRRLFIYIIRIILFNSHMKATYWVDWYRNGFCYRSTHGVTIEQVREMKKLAKLLGETIKYERE